MTTVTTPPATVTSPPATVTSPPATGSTPPATGSTPPATVSAPPPTVSTSDVERDLRTELAAAHEKWKAAESTRSALTVFSIVIAGVALIASIVAWSFSAQRNTTTMQMSSPAAAAPAAAFASPQVAVALTEFAVGLPATRLTAGAKTLQITNGGSMVHELLIFRPDSSVDPKNLPVDPAGNIIEEAPGINKISDGDNIDPGKIQSRTVDLTPGTYVFVCNLAGHFKMGMNTVVTVVAPNA